MMSTNGEDGVLGSALFGKTRRTILALLFGRPDEAFYLRELARAAGLGLGAVQREVQRLSEAGILRRSARGRQVYYKANPKCPIFSELKNLMVETSRADDLLRSAAAPPTDRVQVVSICEPYSGGDERLGSNLNVLATGEVNHADVTAEFLPDEEAIIGWQASHAVYLSAESGEKSQHDSQFVETVLGEPVIFLIRDDSELEDPIEKRPDEDTTRRTD